LVVIPLAFSTPQSDTDGVINTERCALLYYSDTRKELSRSTSIRIAEVDNCLQRNERQKAPVEDVVICCECNCLSHGRTRTGGFYVHSEGGFVDANIPAVLGLADRAVCEQPSRIDSYVYPEATTQCGWKEAARTNSNGKATASLISQRIATGLSQAGWTN